MEKSKQEEWQPFAYWLHGIRGVGNKKIQELLAVFNNPKEVYFQNPRELKNILTPAQLSQFIEHQKSDPYEIYGQLQKKNIVFLPFYHDQYPERLKQIPDSPSGIFLKGKLPQEDRLSVALIGARNCSEYGKYVARQFGNLLGQEKIQIISGMARGIDGIGQKAALEAGGDSYAVLGCGVDICYPRENQGLYQQLIDRGGVLSEYMPGTQPEPQLFPPRNRIISGLADIVLVVEARMKSGTFITVDMALEQGKEVYVVPGRITDPLSRGCNQLVKQGAEAVLDAEDFLQQITGKAAKIRKISISPKEEIEEIILKTLDFYPQSLDCIYEKICTQAKQEISVPLLLDNLIKMVIKGYIIQCGAGNYAKKN